MNGISKAGSDRYPPWQLLTQTKLKAPFSRIDESRQLASIKKIPRRIGLLKGFILEN